jgi:lysophospholipase L1-like esterase
MKILVLGAVLVCALLTWFMMSGREVITNYPPKNERIVAFGDSLVAGVGARDGNDLMSQLEKYIGRPITNLGVSGYTQANTTRDHGSKSSHAI